MEEGGQRALALQWSPEQARCPGSRHARSANGKPGKDTTLEEEREQPEVGVSELWIMYGVRAARNIYRVQLKCQALKTQKAGQRFLPSALPPPTPLPVPTSTIITGGPQTLKLGQSPLACSCPNCICVWYSEVYPPGTWRLHFCFHDQCQH